MKRLLIYLAMLMLPVTGCANTVTATASNKTFCTGDVKRLSDEHADALLIPGTPDAVIISGVALLSVLEAACGRPVT
jgi:hypothetical protein